ncbi:MAG: antibiotic biosynthesis monooxygenase [Candidatus Limnocylindria bacterium]
MHYTRLAIYDVTKGSFDELTSIAEKGILPMFVNEPGFVNYGLVDAGNHKVVSISIWETREAAQKSASICCDLGQGEHLRPGSAGEHLHR